MTRFSIQSEYSSLFSLAAQGFGIHHESCWQIVQQLKSITLATLIYINVNLKFFHKHQVVSSIAISAKPGLAYNEIGAMG